MIRMFVALCLVVALPATAQIYKWVDDSGRMQFSDKPPPEAKSRSETTPTAQSKPKSLQVATHSGYQSSTRSSVGASMSDTDPSSTLVALRSLLERQQFDELNLQLHRVSDNVKQDVTQEPVEAFIYTNFPIASQRHLALTNEWISHSPQVYFPYLVRAHIYYAMAWNARGGGYASDMSEQARTGMHKYVDLLKADVKKALLLDGYVAPAYMLLITSNSMAANDDEMHRYYKLGTTRIPASYLIHSAYMFMNSPRWGGSYEYLEEVSTYANEKAHLNPRLGQMSADVLLQVGLDLNTAKEYEKAIDVFDQAIAIAPCARCFKYKGDSLKKLERYDESINAYHSALALNPYKAETYYSMAWAYRNLDKYREALEAMNIALNISPAKKSYLEKTSKFTISLAKYNARNATTVNRISADDDYALTQKVSPRNSELAYIWFLYFKAAGDLSSGFTELEKAIAYNPDCFKCIKALDNEIARYNQDWPRILELWKPFLARNPNHAEALLEVAGTSYHMKDYAAMRSYTERAVTLGNEDALQFLK